MTQFSFSYRFLVSKDLVDNCLERLCENLVWGGEGSGVGGEEGLGSPVYQYPFLSFLSYLFSYLILSLLSYPFLSFLSYPFSHLILSLLSFLILSLLSFLLSYPF